MAVKQKKLVNTIRVSLVCLDDNEAVVYVDCLYSEHCRTFPANNCVCIRLCYTVHRTTSCGE